MPMVIADARQPDYPIVLANQAFLDLTGYSSEEIVGRNCRFLQGQSTSASDIAEVRSAIADGRSTTVELLNYRKNGKAFWNQLHISPIYDEAGDLAYFFASQADVTEYRKIQDLEASEHRLLMEVDHRAKNVLAVVNSVVRLTRSDDPARYAAAVQQRVEALAFAHELLADRGWREVDLKDIIQRQVQRFTISDIELLGPPLMISAAIVQPMALVIHELATNAAIHGALSKPEGHLVIEWESLDGNRGFSLSWQETGSPQPKELRQGFGTVMIKAMVEKQLLGHVNRRWHADGVTINLEVPNRQQVAGVGPASIIGKDRGPCSEPNS